MGAAPRRHHNKAALIVFAAAATSFFGAEAQSPLRHGFDISYRSFGLVSVDSDFVAGAEYSLRSEGCYARASPEAVCGFTLKALVPLTVTNLQNASHALRADGARARTCCVFVAGDPNGYPLTAPGAPADGVRPLERRLQRGESLGIILRIPDYAQGAPIKAVVFSRGAGDLGVNTPVTVRDLAAAPGKGADR